MTWSERLFHPGDEEGCPTSAELSVQANLDAFRQINRTYLHTRHESFQFGREDLDQVLASGQVGREAILELQGHGGKQLAVAVDVSFNGKFFAQAEGIAVDAMENRDNELCMEGSNLPQHSQTPVADAFAPGHTGVQDQDEKKEKTTGGLCPPNSPGIHDLPTGHAYKKGDDDQVVTAPTLRICPSCRA
jgi:hypothetical protein